MSKTATESLNSVAVFIFQTKSIKQNIVIK